MLRLSVNNALEKCSLLTATDSSFAKVDPDGILSVAVGQRHLHWTQTTTADRWISYINKAGGLAFDTFIMSRADQHVGRSFKMRSFSAYSGTFTDHISSSNWLPTLVGARGQDYVDTSFNISNAQALSIFLSGAYTKKVYPFYFCSSFEFPKVDQFSASIQPNYSVMMVNRIAYLLEETISIALTGLSKANVESLSTMYKLQESPTFLYDSSGTILSDKLWHGIISKPQFSQIADNLFGVSFDFNRLRSYV